MLRRWKVPEQDLKFDEELFQEELNWLKRDQEGLILHSEAPAEIGIIFVSSLFLSLIIGASLGAVVTYFTGSLIPLIIGIIFVFTVSFIIQRKPYSSMKLDSEYPEFEYTGVILFAGEENTTRYRGPIEVIDATEIIRKRKKLYFRFTTNSGYLLTPFENGEFSKRLQEVGLCELNSIQKNIDENKVIESGKFDIYYRQKFDRSEFKQKLKVEREERKKRENAEKQEMKKRLLEESRRRRKKD